MRVGGEPARAGRGMHAEKAQREVGDPTVKQDRFRRVFIPSWFGQSLREIQRANKREMYAGSSLNPLRSPTEIAHARHTVSFPGRPASRHLDSPSKYKTHDQSY